MRQAAGVPLSLQLLAWLEKDLSKNEIEEVAGIATYPLVALMSATQAMRENLKVLSASKSSKNLPQPVTPINDFNDFIGFPRIDALQKKFMVSEHPGA